MECIPRGNAPAYIEWIYSTFGSCVYGYRDAFSIFLGYASIFCWLNAQVPQMMENHKLRSADGLSLYLLYFWLAGDLGNMFSCVLNHQLPFQTYLAAYFVFTDIVLLGQYFHFGEGDTSNSLCSENALKVNDQQSDDMDDEESRLLIASVSALEMSETNDSTTYGSTTDNSKSTSTFIMGLLLFGIKVGSTQLTTETITGAITTTTTPVSVGCVLAWTCTTFYLVSRVPQIHKNYKRQSTQGLSLALFSFAASGNITYASSILVHPGHTRQTFMEALPYLSGSVGTLLLDLVIFGQFMYYRNKYNSHNSIDATTTTLNRVLTHQ